MEFMTNSLPYYTLFVSRKSSVGVEETPHLWRYSRSIGRDSEPCLTTTTFDLPSTTSTTLNIVTLDSTLVHELPRIDPKIVFFQSVLGQWRRLFVVSSSVSCHGSLVFSISCDWERGRSLCIRGEGVPGLHCLFSSPFPSRALGLVQIGLFVNEIS